MAARLAVGVDLGGTQTKAAVLDAEHRILRRAVIDTCAGQGPPRVIGRIVELIDGLLAAHGAARDDVAAVGVGAPGPLSHASGVVLHAPNLPGWHDIPLRDRLAEACGLRVTVENDANAAAYGEFVAGAGAGMRDMVLMTLGTGIGGGVIVDGKLHRGFFDSAGEIGHTIVQPDGLECPCGQRGCLERYASAAAVARRAVEAIRGGEASKLAEALGARGTLDARDVDAAAAAGDPLAARVWDDACRYLAIAAINIQHTLNPGLIVLFGGLAQAEGRLLDPLRAHFERLTWRSAPDHPRFALSALGGDAGVIGAAALARLAVAPR